MSDRETVLRIAKWIRESDTEYPKVSDWDFDRKRNLHEGLRYSDEIADAIEAEFLEGSK